jgi:nucleoside-diphosphate-sugar epimerase
MTDLVIGASGFLGRRLAEMLVARGDDVSLLARQSSRVDDLPGTRPVIRCSLDDVDCLSRAMRDVRFVYNCAGLSSDWGRWEDFRAANVDGVANLLQAARQASVERVVHVSTTDIYGYPREPCDETRGFHDVGLPYNRSKGLGDDLVLDFHRRTGLPVTVVRPATIFGPRSKDWVVELSRLLIAGRAVTVGGGRARAGLVYVDDVADVMARLAATDSAIGEAYNVVDPTPIGWRDYFDRVANALGVAGARLDIREMVAFGLAHLSEAIYRLLGVESRPLFTRHVALLLTRDQHYDTAKLRNILAGFPATGLARGLALTTAWLGSPEGGRAIGRDPGVA